MVFTHKTGVFYFWQFDCIDSFKNLRRGLIGLCKKWLLHLLKA